jgi:hypothetical protein
VDRSDADRIGLLPPESTNPATPGGHEKTLSGWGRQTRRQEVEKRKAGIVMRATLHYATAISYFGQWPRDSVDDPTPDSAVHCP